MTDLVTNKVYADKLIEDNIYLVSIIAYGLRKKYGGKFWDMDDIIADGMIGLIQAARKFDPTKGVKFQTFARRRIAGSMVDGYRKYNRVLRDPMSIKKNGGIKSTVVSLLNDTGASSINVDVSSSDQAQFHEIIPDNNPTPEERVLDTEKIDVFLPQYIKLLISCLDEKETLVIQMYYFDELTMQKIGEKMSLTEGRICQIHKQAIEKLKNSASIYDLEN